MDYFPYKHHFISDTIVLTEYISESKSNYFAIVDPSKQPAEIRTKKDAIELIRKLDDLLELNMLK